MKIRRKVYTSNPSRGVKDVMIDLSDSIESLVNDVDPQGRVEELSARVTRLTSVVGTLAEVLLRNKLINEEELSHIIHYSHEIVD